MEARSCQLATSTKQQSVQFIYSSGDRLATKKTTPLLLSKPLPELFLPLLIPLIRSGTTSNISWEQAMKMALSAGVWRQQREDNSKAMSPLSLPCSNPRAKLIHLISYVSPQWLIKGASYPIPLPFLSPTQSYLSMLWQLLLSSSLPICLLLSH